MFCGLKLPISRDMIGKTSLTLPWPNIMCSNIFQCCLPDVVVDRKNQEANIVHF